MESTIKGEIRREARRSDPLPCVRLSYVDDSIGKKSSEVLNPFLCWWIIPFYVFFTGLSHSGGPFCRTSKLPWTSQYSLIHSYKEREEEEWEVLGRAESEYSLLVFLLVPVCRWRTATTFIVSIIPLRSSFWSMMLSLALSLALNHIFLSLMQKWRRYRQRGAENESGAWGWPVCDLWNSQLIGSVGCNG